MPRKVNADARRQDVVEALFRVAVRDGLARASLRSVADEARLNIGSLRHYFASQPELMRFAMQAMLDHVEARISRRLADLDRTRSASYDERVRHAVALLGELLPLDQARREEIIVFLDFSSLSRTKPELAELAVDAARASRTASRIVLAYLTGLTPDSPDLAAEAERLTSLIDGLGINAALYPTLVDPPATLAVLHTHLRALAGYGTDTVLESG